MNGVEQAGKRGLTHRYFTYAGPVLISVNPRDPMLKNELFSPFKLHEYSYDSLKNKQTPELRPHLYSVTLSAYSAMIAEQKNQVVSFLGERGTAKT